LRTFKELPRILDVETAARSGPPRSRLCGGWTASMRVSTSVACTGCRAASTGGRVLTDDSALSDTRQKCPSCHHPNKHDRHVQRNVSICSHPRCRRIGQPSRRIVQTIKRDTSRDPVLTCGMAGHPVRNDSGEGEGCSKELSRSIFLPLPHKRFLLNLIFVR
jgi:hypothetical protein